MFSRLGCGLDTLLERPCGFGIDAGVAQEEQGRSRFRHHHAPEQPTTAGHRHRTSRGKAVRSVPDPISASSSPLVGGGLSCSSSFDQGSWRRSAGMDTVPSEWSAVNGTAADGGDPDPGAPDHPLKLG
jgi:hypothetical protein